MKAKSFDYLSEALKFMTDIEKPGMNNQEVVSVVMDRDSKNIVEYIVFYRPGDYTQ